MWKEIKKDMGEVRVGKKVTIDFEYEGELEFELTKFGKPYIQLSCGCTSYSITKFPSKTRITLVYTPGDIPYQLKKKKQTFYNTNKTMLVKYKDSEGKIKEQLLIFTAKVIG